MNAAWFSPMAPAEQTEDKTQVSSSDTVTGGTHTPSSATQQGVKTLNKVVSDTFNAMQQMNAKGLYEQLVVTDHRIFEQFEEKILEDVNSTGMSQRELEERNMRHPAETVTGKRNYVKYVAKILAFAMRCRGRLDENAAGTEQIASQR